MTPVGGHSKRVPHRKTAWSHAAMAARPSQDEINDCRKPRVSIARSDSGLFSN
jgi:hypothetical protein